MRRRRVVNIPLPDPEEDQQAQRDAIRWLIRQAVRLGDCKSAEECVALAYDINDEIAAAEIARRSKRRLHDKAAI